MIEVKRTEKTTIELKQTDDRTQKSIMKSAEHRSERGCDSSERTMEPVTDCFLSKFVTLIELVLVRYYVNEHM